MGAPFPVTRFPGCRSRTQRPTDQTQPPRRTLLRCPPPPRSVSLSHGSSDVLVLTIVRVCDPADARHPGLVTSWCLPASRLCIRHSLMLLPQKRVSQAAAGAPPVVEASQMGPAKPAASSADSHGEAPNPPRYLQYTAALEVGCCLSHNQAPLPWGLHIFIRDASLLILKRLGGECAMVSQQALLHGQRPPRRRLPWLSAIVTAHPVCQVCPLPPPTAANQLPGYPHL